MTLDIGLGRLQGVELMQVVAVHVTRGALGDDSNPCRSVSQYWSAEGELLAEFDRVGPSPDYLGLEVLRLRVEVLRLRGVVRALTDRLEAAAGAAAPVANPPKDGSEVSHA